jgi:three-Cys-motif partner protein
VGSDAEGKDQGGVSGRPRRKRSWGYWTEAKLDLLARYLDAFTTATKYKSPRERIYLDAFAGEGYGVSRTTGEEFESSSRIALGVDDPPFSRLRFFELGRKAARLERELRTDYGERDFKVVRGDCNETIPQTLAELRALGVAWAPTFAFLDPDGMELRWDTVKALAEHKGRERNKVELWILFTAPGLMRVLKRDPAQIDEHEEALATDLFGNERWAAIQQLRFANEIEPPEARDEFVNLYRWQLERDLGYRWTHPLEVKNLAGHPVYSMVFATDNEAGNRIMGDLYNDAANRLPGMRREAFDRVRGQLTLGIEESEQPRLELYGYEPPWEPPL